MVARFWAIIDSESVRLYQIVMYSCFYWGGLYMAFFGEAPSVVRTEMGNDAHMGWITLLTVCPPVVLVGCKIKNKYAGLWLQLAGDIGITSALVAYCSAIQASWWGKGVFSVWGFIGLSICTSVLAIRDIRRLFIVEHISKEL